MSALYSVLNIHGSMMQSTHSSLTQVYICVIWLSTHLLFLPTSWDSLCSPRAGPGWLWTPKSSYFCFLNALIKGMHHHGQLLLAPFKIMLCVYMYGTCEFSCMLRSERYAKYLHWLLSYCLEIVSQTVLARPVSSHDAFCFCSPILALQHTVTLSFYMFWGI